jgi:hypothetical protein
MNCTLQGVFFAPVVWYLDNLKKEVQTMPFEFAAGMFLPGHFRAETVRRVVDYAHDIAQLLGFETVGDVFDVDAETIQDVVALIQRDLEDRTPKLEHPYVFWPGGADERMCQVAEIVERYAARAVGARWESPLIPKDYTVYPSRLIGFYACSGKGCGPLYFAFARYPREAALISADYAHNWYALTDPNEHGALRVSEAHFVQCHLRHVWLFRIVKKRFPYLKLWVQDDGKFWQSEDVDRLLTDARVYAAFVNLVANDLRQNGCEVIVPGEGTLSSE